jgi:hypothetical protein
MSKLTNMIILNIHLWLESHLVLSGNVRFKQKKI